MGFSHNLNPIFCVSNGKVYTDDAVLTIEAEVRTYVLRSVCPCVDIIYLK